MSYLFKRKSPQSTKSKQDIEQVDRKNTIVLSQPIRVIPLQITETQYCDSDNRPTEQSNNIKGKKNNNNLCTKNEINFKKDFSETYTIIEHLGNSRVSSVFSVTSKEMNTKFCVKKLNKLIIGKNNSEREVNHEIIVMRSIFNLQFPSIVQVLDEQDAIYIVQKYVDGYNILDSLTTCSKFNELDARDVIMQLLVLLDELHNQNLIHRDVQFDNVKISSDARRLLMLIDFGFGKNEISTDSFKCYKSFDYASPESLLGEPLTKKTDIWSLGIMTYIILGGCSPFFNLNKKLMKFHICRAKLLFPKQSWRHISKDAKDFISKALTRDPNQRPDAKALLNHPWISTSDDILEQRDISDNLIEIRRYTLRRRFYRAIQALVQMNKCLEEDPNMKKIMENIPTNIISDANRIKEALNSFRTQNRDNFPTFTNAERGNSDTRYEINKHLEHEYEYQQHHKSSNLYTQGNRTSPLHQRKLERYPHLDMSAIESESSEGTEAERKTEMAIKKKNDIEINEFRITSEEIQKQRTNEKEKTKHEAILPQGYLLITTIDGVFSTGGGFVCDDHIYFLPLNESRILCAGSFIKLNELTQNEPLLHKICEKLNLVVQPQGPIQFNISRKAQNQVSSQDKVKELVRILRGGIHLLIEMEKALIARDKFTFEKILYTIQTKNSTTPVVIEKSVDQQQNNYLIHQNRSVSNQFQEKKTEIKLVKKFMECPESNNGDDYKDEDKNMVEKAKIQMTRSPIITIEKLKDQSSQIRGNRSYARSLSRSRSRSLSKKEDLKEDTLSDNEYNGEYEQVEHFDITQKHDQKIKQTLTTALNNCKSKNDYHDKDNENLSNSNELTNPPSINTPEGYSKVYQRRSRRILKKGGSSFLLEETDEELVDYDNSSFKYSENFDKEDKYLLLKSTSKNSFSDTQLPEKEKNCALQQVKSTMNQIHLGKKVSIEEMENTMMFSETNISRHVHGVIASNNVQLLKSELQQMLQRYDLQRSLNAQQLMKIQSTQGNIQVFCRIRPLLSSEIGQELCVDNLSETEISFFETRQNQWKSFAFDRVWGIHSGQQEIFQEIEPLALSVINGYNACIFAYGQTGSGKTYTMIGEAEGGQFGLSHRIMHKVFDMLTFREEQMNGPIKHSSRKNLLSAQMGATPLSSNYPSPAVSRDSSRNRGEKHRSSAFQYSVKLAMVEIYNEQVRDLLNTSKSPPQLEIKHKSDSKMEIPGLIFQTIQKWTDFIQIFNRGTTNRATTATDMNLHSSRSHCILIVDVTTTVRDGPPIEGRLYLVDLAGSENVNKSNVTGESLRQAKFINKSLSALGDVMEALDKKSAHVPYRNSNLTYLLQDALGGGSSRTAMVLAIRPTASHAQETNYALQFATRVRKISLPAAKTNIGVKNLEENLKNLKKQLDDANSDKKELKKQIRKLKNENKESEMKIQQDTETYIRGLESHIRELQNEVEIQKSAYSTLEKRLQREQDTKSYLQEQLTIQIDKIKRENETLIQETRSLQQKIKDGAEREQNLQRYKNQVDVKFKNMEGSVKKLESDLVLFQNTNKSLSKQLKQEVQNREEKLEQKDLEISQFNQKINLYQKELGELRETLAQQSSSFYGIETLRTELEGKTRSRQAMIQEYKFDIEILKQKKERLELQLKKNIELSKEHTIVHKQEIEELLGIIETLNLDVQQLLNGMKPINISNNELSETESLQTINIELLTKLNNGMNGCNHKINGLQKSLFEYKEKLVTFNQQQDYLLLQIKELEAKQQSQLIAQDSNSNLLQQNCSAPEQVECSVYDGEVSIIENISTTSGLQDLKLKRAISSSSVSSKSKTYLQQATTNLSSRPKSINSDNITKRKKFSTPSISRLTQENQVNGTKIQNLMQPSVDRYQNSFVGDSKLSVPFNQRNSSESMSNTQISSTSSTSFSLAQEKKLRDEIISPKPIQKAMQTSKNVEPVKLMKNEKSLDSKKKQTSQQFCSIDKLSNKLNSLDTTKHDEDVKIEVESLPTADSSLNDAQSDTNIGFNSSRSEDDISPVGKSFEYSYISNRDNNNTYDLGESDRQNVSPLTKIQLSHISENIDEKDYMSNSLDFNNSDNTLASMNKTNVGDDKYQTNSIVSNYLLTRSFTTSTKYGQNDTNSIKCENNTILNDNKKIESKVLLNEIKSSFTNTQTVDEKLSLNYSQMTNDTLLDNNRIFTTNELNRIHSISTNQSLISPCDSKLLQESENKFVFPNSNPINQRSNSSTINSLRTDNNQSDICNNNVKLLKSNDQNNFSGEIKNLSTVVLRGDHNTRSPSPINSIMPCGEKINPIIIVECDDEITCESNDYIKFQNAEKFNNSESKKKSTINILLAGNPKDQQNDRTTSPQPIKFKNYNTQNNSINIISGDDNNNGLLVELTNLDENITREHKYEPLVRRSSFTIVGAIDGKIVDQVNFPSTVRKLARPHPIVKGNSFIIIDPKNSSNNKSLHTITSTKLIKLDSINDKDKVIHSTSENCTISFNGIDSNSYTTLKNSTNIDISTKNNCTNGPYNCIIPSKLKSENTQIQEVVFDVNIEPKNISDDKSQQVQLYEQCFDTAHNKANLNDKIQNLFDQNEMKNLHGEILQISQITNNENLKTKHNRCNEIESGLIHQQQDFEQQKPCRQPNNLLLQKEVTTNPNNTEDINKKVNSSTKPSPSAEKTIAVQQAAAKKTNGSTEKKAELLKNQIIQNKEQTMNNNNINKNNNSSKTQLSKLAAKKIVYKSTAPVSKKTLVPKEKTYNNIQTDGEKVQPKQVQRQIVNHHKKETLQN